MATNGNEMPGWFTIFRTDEEERVWLHNELRQGRLRQGWGGPGFGLKTADGRRVEKTQWEATFKAEWKEDPSPKRFAILTQMLDMEPGSAVVIPKMPEWDQFTIARVSGDYRFELGQDWDDYGHIVPVDPDSVRIFSYRADDEAYLVSGLFSRANHRAAVSFCYNTEIVEAAHRLLQRQNNLTSKPHEELSGAVINEVFKEAAKSLSERVKSWNADRFEKAVEQAFRYQGFTIIRRRQSDGQGGDADLLVSPPPSPYSLFLPAKIAVQMKWKQGKDHGDEEAVRQIVKWAESAKSDAAKYVISSASGFTDKAGKLAEEHDVVLIGGLQTMCFLLGVPDRYRDDWNEEDNTAQATGCEYISV